MPPSGFNQKAINGLLEFVRYNYESILKDYKVEDLKESSFLEKTAVKLKANITEYNEGLQTFVIECYKDLVEEIKQGHDKYNRPVIEGKAMEKEIKQIKEYLVDFKI